MNTRDEILSLHKSAIELYSRQLMTCLGTLQEIMTRFDREKTRFLEDLGDLNGFEMPKPPEFVVSWVNNANPEVRSSTPPLAVNEEEDKPEHSMNNLIGRMEMKVDDINIKIQPSKPKKELEDSGFGDSTLTNLNNQYRTKSIGINVDLVSSKILAPKKRRKILKDDDNVKEKKAVEESTTFSMKKGTYLEDTIVAPEFPSQSYQPSQEIPQQNINALNIKTK